MVFNFFDISKQLTKTIVEITNNFAEVPEEVLQEAQRNSSAPSRVVEALEQHLYNANLSDGGFSVVTPNVAVEVSGNCCWLSFISKATEK